MFEDNNRIDPESMKNTEEPKSEEKLEADIEEQEDGRYSRKVYKSRIVVAVIAIIIMIMVVNWGSIMFIADYVASWFNGGISNDEGITVFPDGYSEIYSKIQMISDDNDGGSSNNTSKPNFDSVIVELEAWRGSDVFESCLKKADVIKIDGDYLYAVSSGNISILKIDGDDLEEISTITKDEDDEFVPFEIYLLKKRLVVLSNINSSNDDKKVVAETYNIADKKNPVLLNTAGQSGEYLSSYMIDDAMYLITKHRIKNAEEKKPETFVPVLYNNNESNVVDFNDVCIYNNIDTPEYIVVTGINVAKEGKIVSNKSLLGYGSSIYMDAESLYITSYRQKCTEEKIYNSTDITRLELNNGKIKFRASGNIPGYIIGESAINEQWNTLRVVTQLYGADRDDFELGENDEALETNSELKYTLNEDLLGDEVSSCLYIMNMELDIVGKLEGMYIGEKIYSTMFSGAKLYMTVGEDFESVEIDLSNQGNPVIVEEGGDKKSILNRIKLYSEKYAVGFDAEEDGTELCISMYKISEMKGLLPIDDIVLDDYSILDFKFNTTFVDEKTGTIAFIINDKLVVCSYSDKKLEFVDEVELKKDFDGYTDGIYDNASGVIKGEYIYIYVADVIQIYNASDVDLCNTVSLG